MPEQTDTEIITSANVGNLKDILPDLASPAEDAFADAGTVKGLEMLGRGITDKRGAPSGSPANWEVSRGVTAEPESLTEEEHDTAVGSILAALLPEGVNRAEPEDRGEFGSDTAAD